jgi:hypothetical protein
MAEITLTPLEWHIAVLSDGHRSLRDVAHEAGASEFAVATALLTMSNAGLLALPAAADHAEDDVDEDDDADDDVEDDHGAFAQEEDSEEGDDFSYGETHEGPAAAENGSDEELDPAELLRELGERTTGPRGRRMAPPTREEQRLRLRSR